MSDLLESPARDGRAVRRGEGRIVRPACPETNTCQGFVPNKGVKIDGVPLRVRPGDWVRKAGFRMGGGAGAAAGYFYVLDGLSPGTHTIVLFTRVEPPGAVFRSRMTVTLTVR